MSQSGNALTSKMASLILLTAAAISVSLAEATREIAIEKKIDEEMEKIRTTKEQKQKQEDAIFEEMRRAQSARDQEEIEKLGITPEEFYRESTSKMNEYAAWVIRTDIEWLPSFISEEETFKPSKALSVYRDTLFRKHSNDTCDLSEHLNRQSQRHQQRHLKKQPLQHQPLHPKDRPTTHQNYSRPHRGR